MIFKLGKLLPVGIFLSAILSFAAFYSPSVQASVFELPMDEILNAHYNTDILIKAGRNGAVYHLTAQEDKGGGIGPIGAISLVFVSENNIQFVSGMSLWRPPPLPRPTKKVILEGVEYKIKYELRSGQKGLDRLWRGDLLVLAPEKETGLPSYKIPVEQIAGAWFKMMVPLADSFKLLVFTDRKGQGPWIILVKAADCSSFGDFNRIHVDTRELPLSRVSPPGRTYSVEFEKERFSFAITEKDGRRHLYIKVGRE